MAKKVYSSKFERPVEFLRALDDHTWDTVIVNVPKEVHYDDLKVWAETHLMTLTEHRRTVLMAVYAEGIDEVGDDT